jgi:hypothetical protein
VAWASLKLQPGQEVTAASFRKGEVGSPGNKEADDDEGDDKGPAGGGDGHDGEDNEEGGEDEEEEEAEARPVETITPEEKREILVIMQFHKYDIKFIKRYVWFCNCSLFGVKVIPQCVQAALTCTPCTTGYSSRGLLPVGVGAVLHHDP